MGGLVVMDISDPAAPGYITSIDTQGEPQSIAFASGYVYLPDGWTDKMLIFDVSTPENPIPVGEIAEEGYPVAAISMNDELFLLSEESSLRIFDASQPADPVEIGVLRLQGRITSVKVNGVDVYAAGSNTLLRALDITNPTQWVQIGETVNTGDVLNFDIDNDYAYLLNRRYAGEYGNRLIVIDIHDPTQLTEVGRMELDVSPSGIAVAGDYAFITEMEPPRLEIINIRQPESPTRAGRIDLPGENAFDVALAGDYAYVAGGYSGLFILDISQPVSPTLVTTYELIDESLGIEIRNDLAFVADRANMLHILNIVNPAHPVEIGRFPISEPTGGVTAAGDYVYLSTRKGVEVVNISDPAAPRSNGYYSIQGNGNEIDFDENLIYLPRWGGGLYSLLYTPSIDLTPLEAGHLGSPDGGTALNIPDHAVDSNTHLTFTPQVTPTHPAEEIGFGGIRFHLDARNISSVPVEAFLRPALVTLYYEEDEVAGLAEGTLRLFIWDTEQAAWRDAAETCSPAHGYERDLGKNQLSLRICSLGEFALLGLPHGPTRLFIPVLNQNYPQTYSLSGRVTDALNHSVVGVRITLQTGQWTETADDGSYQLNSLLGGNYVLTPSKDGMRFTPENMHETVPPDDEGCDFRASFICSDIIVNGGFEESRAWALPITVYPASYSTTRFHSGTRSMRTGITNAEDNRYSYSSARQTFRIEAGAGSATLRMWIYPKSGEALNGLKPLLRAGEPFGEWPLLNDLQYILILDQSGNILKTLFADLLDARGWAFYEFDLLRFAGRTITLHFGTYNDGWDGVSSMYVDDVSLEVCP
jgi:hypothetical protein